MEIWTSNSVRLARRLAYTALRTLLLLQSFRRMLSNASCPNIHNVPLLRLAGIISFMICRNDITHYW